MNTYLWNAQTRYLDGDTEFRKMLTWPCDLHTALCMLEREVGEGYKVVSMELWSEDVLDLRK